MKNQKQHSNSDQVLLKLNFSSPLRWGFCKVHCSMHFLKVTVFIGDLADIFLFSSGVKHWEQSRNENDGIGIQYEF